jgi:hypothetical protein
MVNSSYNNVFFKAYKLIDHCNFYKKNLLSLFIPFLLPLLLTSASYGAVNDSCPGSLEDTLSSYDTSYSNSYEVRRDNNPNDYLRFEIAEDGLVTIEATVGWRNRPYHLSVSKISCGGTDIYGRISAKNHFGGSLTDIPVSNGDTIYVRIDAEGYNNNRRRNLNLSVSWSPPPDPKETCPGQQIANLHGTTSSASKSYDDEQIDGYKTYYYYFTPQVAGTFDVDVDSNKYSYDLKVLDGCGGSVLGSQTDDDYDKSVHAIAVNAGQTIVVSVYRDYSTTMTYDIDFAYTVTANQPPVANNVNASTSVDTPVTIHLDASDPDGDSLTYTMTDPGHGQLSGSAPDITYTPEAGYTGTDTFTYHVCDTHDACSDEATVTITISNISESSGGRDFELRHQENIYGDVKVIGNTVLCIHDYSGDCIEPWNDNSNAYTDLQKAPQSWSQLDIPEDATIVYARLYWQGRKEATSRNLEWDDESKSKAGKINLKIDETGNWHTVLANILDLDYTYADSYIRTYSASADVTGLIMPGSHKYYIDTASFYTSTGKTKAKSPDDGLGNYGAWTLVVVYKDPNSENARNISIFDGFKQVNSDLGHVDISVSGFLTPKTGQVDSKLYVFTAEGDKYISGDHFKMAGERYNASLQDIAPTTDNAFDSRIDVNAIRGPELNNNNGIDIQEYSVGTTPGAKGIITNEEYGAKFQFTSTQDTYFPSLLIFSTKIRDLDLCYDYTYGQKGYFVLASDTQGMTIDGTFDTSVPLDVKLYVRNQENSDIVVSNLNVNIEDINVTQAKYRRDSTYVARPNSHVEQLPDQGRDVNDTYNRDIDIGGVGAEDHFYIYYSLDLIRETVNMPIHVYIEYDLTVNIDGKTIPLGHQSMPLQNVGICKDNGTYQPTYGQFNVVHPAMTRSGNPDYYYNLPTQIVKRPEEYKLEFMVPGSDGKYNRYGDTSYLVAAAVETISVDGFHYTDATCTDENATKISRAGVWGFIDAGGHLTELNATEMANAGFFDRASSNTAFLISVPVDENGSMIIFDKLGEDSYRLHNFPNYGGDRCAPDFVPPVGNSMQISSWCGSNTGGNSDHGGGGQSGLSLSSGEVRTCLQCIFGFRTERLCSRDNFAIRPEAFYVTLRDTNQSTSTSASGITVSTNAPAPASTNLSAGYSYLYDVNATTHTGNNASPGYSAEINATLAWSPHGSVDESKCNDTSDKNNSFSFAGGSAHKIFTLNQVGEYSLTMTDSEWTRVDHISEYMAHHVSPYFQTGSNVDCKENNDSVQTSANGGINGCDISTTHTNVDTSTNYTNLHFRFYPYDFDVSGINVNVGPSGRSHSQNYIYINTPPKTTADENEMHYNISGTFYAEGKNGARLSNFVSGCYADDTDMNISIAYHKGPEFNETTTTPPVETPYLSYALQESNGTDEIIRPAPGSTTDFENNISGFDVNTTHILIPQDKTFYAKDMNGSVKLKLRLNFERNISKPLNPRFIQFKDLNISYRVQPGTLYVDGKNNHTIFGDLTLDHNVTFIYGRAKPSKFFYDDVTENSVKTPILTVVYSEDPTIMPSPQFKMTNEHEWYFNPNHFSGDGDGSVTLVPTDGNGTVTPSPAIDAGRSDTAIVTAGSATRPLIVDINLTGTDPWLIYNPDKEAEPAPFYRVRFIGTSDWAGYGKTGNVVESNASKKKLHRLEW